MENFCVKVSGDKEACEVIARAVANGAILAKMPGGHIKGEYWGVYGGETEAGYVKNELTMDQLRAKYQLPCEQTEWDGTGLPPVGTVCEMSGPNDGKWYEAEMLAHRDGFAIGWSGSFGGVLYSNDIYDFRKLRTERERFINMCVAGYSGAYSSHFVESVAAQIWDAGLGKLPEVSK